MRDSSRAMGFALLAATVTALVATPPGADQEDDTTIRLPVSFDNVWYRPATKSGFGSGRQKGLLTVTAEGVETEGARRKLTEMGCDMAQGNLFSRPVPVDQLKELLD